MLETLQEIDLAIFFNINHDHSVVKDLIMGFFTDKLSWIPLYIAILIGLVRHYKMRVIFVLVVIGATIACADLFASALCKPLFARLRPCHDPALEGLVHLLPRGCGGLYSFISSHAANTFGLATVLFLLLRDKVRFLWLFFVWAALVSYSRIYVGVHYPSDIIVGALTGILWANLFVGLYRRIIPKHIQ